MPIIVNDSWVSGGYTAYVSYGNFIDSPSSFEVVNHSISEDTVILEIEDEEITIEELTNYSIILSNSQSFDSVHYTVMMKSYSGKTPIEPTPIHNCVWV